MPDDTDTDKEAEDERKTQHYSVAAWSTIEYTVSRRPKHWLHTALTTLDATIDHGHLEWQLSQGLSDRHKRRLITQWLLPHQS